MKTGSNTENRDVRIHIETRRGTSMSFMLLLGTIFISLVAAEETPPTGAGTFMEHCAVCHGASGTGDGSYAEMLRVPPTDLTLLSKVNGGKFPQRRVERSTDGRTMLRAHGTSAMPIWGRQWTRMDGGEEVDVKARLIVLISFLRSIQK